MNKKGKYEKYLKRVFDLIFSFVAIIFLSPLLLIVAMLVRMKLGKPVIFKQNRPGKDEKIFTMYKFRTMTDSRDQAGNLLPDGERLTKFGKFLRSSSLDEIPELINIIKGEMSIIGPRPQLVKDLVFMSDEQRIRHSIKPGLTGLSQVSGRNNLTWEEKLSIDLVYQKKITFLLDMKIIIYTITKVILRKDVSSVGMETAEDYGDYLLRTNQLTRKEYLEKLEMSSKYMEV